jgi:hypothetical protein
MSRHPARPLAALAASTLILSALGASPVRALTYLGANLGASVLTDDDESVTVFGLPHSGDILLGGMRPGVRLGAIGASGGPELYLDGGLTLHSMDGETFHSVVGVLNYQQNFSPASATTPYLTFGGGFGHAGTSGDGSTLWLAGAGLGMRHWFAHRHGAGRFEVRYDRMTDTENEESGVNVISVKLGFDVVIGGL